MEYMGTDVYQKIKIKNTQLEEILEVLKRAKTDIKEDCWREYAEELYEEFDDIYREHK